MMNNLSETISRRLLPRVQSPAQYIGGEVNQVRKNPRPGDVTIALAFPDTYAIGMSHLGLMILYDTLNRRDHIVAERVYCPWIDAVEIMQQEDMPLFAWESRRPVRDFDILAISLQHELSYSNVLLLLDLVGIPLRAEDRTDSDPLVMGGGPIADSCEPVADFFDLIILSDGEEAQPAVVEAIRDLKNDRASRGEILHSLARQFPYVYVPALYRCEYNADNTLKSSTPIATDIPALVQRAVVTNMETAPFPTAPLIPYVETPHDRIAIEVMRGCPQRCAFCHAGHTKGRVRTRSVEKIVEIAWESYRNTGHDTVSLLSLSTSDYPQLGELVRRLYETFEGRHVGISLPSLRVDKQLHEVPSQVTGTRREGLTLAVETASDTIRKAIGKKVTDSDLLDTLAAAFRAGWRKAKLYFMIGFPGETEDDILGILDLAAAISRLGKDIFGSPAAVTAAVSWLVPKPHTPFAWIPQQPVEYFQNARHTLIAAKRELRGASISLKFHHMERSILEGVFARGDRRLSHAIETAYRNGARFDCWDECFDYQRYLDAFARHHIAPDFYAHRGRGEHEPLPWDHLAGSNREHLYIRLQRMMKIIESR